ncbi:MAG: DEAD/DEAH box helicase [Geminicoccaceae bacterium]
MTSFSDLGLAAPLLRALATEGYEAPTPIQAQAIPHVLAGRDLLGIAQTGTGKTAAFALPILHRLAADRRAVGPHACRVLVLAPTRELAGQIEDSFAAYGADLPLSSTVVYGGVDIRRQQRAMSRGDDILVATPGRLVDHLGQRSIRLDKVEVVVLDEVDRMLDIGSPSTPSAAMSHVPRQRQSLFFSATLPKEIAALASEFLHDPAKVADAGGDHRRARGAERGADQAAKKAVLATILGGADVSRAIVFTCTKHRADQVTRHLQAAGIGAAAIHGNKSQNNRERALGGFKDGTTKVLVATDIAARGIDVDAVSHVVNFDLPDVPETYVHCIGRTARRAEGQAIAFKFGRRGRQPARHREADPQAVPVLRPGNRSTTAQEAAARPTPERRPGAQRRQQPAPANRTRNDHGAARGRRSSAC